MLPSGYITLRIVRRNIEYEVKLIHNLDTPKGDGSWTAFITRPGFPGEGLVDFDTLDQLLTGDDKYDGVNHWLKHIFRMRLLEEAHGGFVSV
jgi:hypothetical protein